MFVQEESKVYVGCSGSCWFFVKTTCFKEGGNPPHLVTLM